MTERRLKTSNRARQSPPGQRLFKCLLMAVAMGAAGSVAHAQEPYQLGPQDTLRIRVYEWRPSTASTFEWAPLTGEFTISSSGNLSLPIVGSVPASGKTLEELADEISVRLQSEVGLQKRPNASVEVSAYRPVFVAGLVTNPGKYTFSPGLTVIQALSMAGGVGPTDTSIVGLQKDALVSRGDIKSLEEEQLGLLGKQARVDALLQHAPAVTFPAELTSRVSEPGVSRILEEEGSLFAARQRAISVEIESLDRAKELALNQIEALNSKAASLAKQLELATNDLASVNKLVSQGLTVSARQLGASQNVAELESRSLDVSLALFRTQQDLAKVDQDRSSIRNRYDISALTESAELRDRIASNLQKIATARSLLRNLEIRAPAAMASLAEAGGAYVYHFSVSRVIDGSLNNLLVNENDPLFPGDVLRVARHETTAARGLLTSN
jgi:polysaccharide biosynthesis/export protein ExoF